MKTSISLKGIKIGNIKIGEVSLSAQASLTEVVGTYDLSRRIIKELPNIFADLEIALNKFNEIDSHFSSDMVQGVVEGITKSFTQENEIDSDNIDKIADEIIKIANEQNIKATVFLEEVIKEEALSLYGEDMFNKVKESVLNKIK